MDYQDILYTATDGVATVTINLPKVLNAFRARTCDELIDAFARAGWDRSVGVIVLTGAGDRAFCTGGDQSAHEGGYGGRGTIGLPVEEMHSAIRDAPKPVIAKVRGYAIGGGNVLATVCDLTIAADDALFGAVELDHGSLPAGELQATGQQLLRLHQPVDLVLERLVVLFGRGETEPALGRDDPQDVPGAIEQRPAPGRARG